MNLQLNFLLNVKFGVKHNMPKKHLVMQKLLPLMTTSLHVDLQLFMLLELERRDPMVNEHAVLLKKRLQQPQLLSGLPVIDGHLQTKPITLKSKHGGAMVRLQ